MRSAPCDPIAARARHHRPHRRRRCRVARRREGAARGIRRPHRARTAMHTTGASHDRTRRRPAGRSPGAVAETIDAALRHDRRMARRPRRADLDADAAPDGRDARPGRRAPAPCPRSRADGLITGAASSPRPGCSRRRPLASRVVAAARTCRRVRRLAAVSDPANEQFRDYTTLEWWRVPARTGTRHLTGPYVDYVCTDDYTVTITTPVTVDGRDGWASWASTCYVDRLERSCCR